jgi:hypothetical protein
MSSLKLAAILVFALPTTVWAADPAPPTTPQAAAAAAPLADSAIAVDASKNAAKSKEKVICVREQVVGTKLAKRVCKTSTQIEEERFYAKRARDQMRNEGAVYNPAF